jgi:hypothetical protein
MRLMILLPAAVASGALLAVEMRPVGQRQEPAPAVAPAGPGGARNLTLAPNLSFTDDSSSNFPIRGEGLSDGRIASDRPTVIFFGTAHCWNTNREAERFVGLARRRGESVRFLVVDVEHPSSAQRPLMTRFYRGFIPTLAVLDRFGRAVYDDAGETSSRRGDTTKLERLVEGAANAP